MYHVTAQINLAIKSLLPDQIGSDLEWTLTVVFACGQCKVSYHSICTISYISNQARLSSGQ